MGPLLREIQDKIRSRDYRFTLHAADRATRGHISTSQVELALRSNEAEITEDYSGDPRGPSRLILGFLENLIALHVQSAYPPRIAIIPVYAPRPEEWRNWRVRA